MLEKFSNMGLDVVENIQAKQSGNQFLVQEFPKAIVQA